MFGRSRNVPEEGSLWAFDPRTFTWGWVCFGADKSRPPIDEKLVSVGKPMPDFTKLPDHGFPWTEARGVNMKCVSGIDAGVEVVFKINTIGGVQVIDELIDKVRTQVNRDLAKPPKERDGKVAPFGTLGNDSYPHKDHGKIWIPVMTIVDWMPLDGPAPAPAEPTPPSPGPGPVTAGATEQPRRRRVA